MWVELVWFDTVFRCCSLTGKSWESGHSRKAEREDGPSSCLSHSPPLAKQPLFCSNTWYMQIKAAVRSMKSPLTISPAWCLTCGVPESPSVWVQRHTQNRRRYSLNAPSQGGGPELRKKQSHRSSKQGQIHCGEWRPAIIQASGSSYLSLWHKTQPYEKEDHVSVAFVQAWVFGSYTFCIGSTETNLQS